jgi:hypothetical protein
MHGDNHITTVTGTTQTFALFVLALVLGSLISLISVHLLDREVNPISDAVSDFGARSHAWFYRIAAIWLGFAGLLTAAMFADALFPKPTLVILLLLVFAAVRLAITIFPTDLPGAEETSVGRSHRALAGIAFGTIAAAALFFPASVHGDPFWDPHRTLLNGLALFVLFSAVATAVTHSLTLKNLFGLCERVLYLAMYGWLSAVALILLSG